MNDKTAVRLAEQSSNLELFDSSEDDLSFYEKQRYLARHTADKTTDDNSGVRRRDEIEGATPTAEEATSNEVVSTVESPSPEAPVTAKMEEEQPKINIVLSGEEPMVLPKFGSFIGYNEVRQNRVGGISADLKHTVNLALDNNESVGSTAETTGPKGSAEAAAAPLDFELKFNHSALEALPSPVKAEKELDIEITKDFEDDNESVIKRQKAKLVGIIHCYNNAAELSYSEARKVKKTQSTPSRLANLGGYIKRGIQTLVGVILPNYAIKRNEYETHIAYPVSAKEEAKNRLEADVQSISDSYEVMADYVKIKFGEDFVLDVNNNDDVNTFLDDCLLHQNSPHYKVVKAQTLDRVKARIDQYNEEIAEIDKEVKSAEYKEVTKELLEGSLLLRIKKEISDTFSDVKLDAAGLWAAITGKKASSKDPKWAKREIPSVLGTAVNFQDDHVAYLKSMAEADTIMVEKKIVKDGRNGKRAGFLLSAAAVIAGFVGGGYLIKKAFDGSLNEKAQVGLTNTDKALDGKAAKKTAQSAVSGIATSNTVPAKFASLSNANDPDQKKANETVKPTSVKVAAAKPVAIKSVKTAPALSTSQSKAKTSIAKIGGSDLPKPKSEKVDEKKDVGDQLLSEAMKMEEITFGEKKLKIYASAMEEIAQPIVLADGKKVPYKPDLLAFNAKLEEIGQAHLTLKTRKDATALHALYAGADQMIGEYQIARDRIVVPNYVVESDMNVGMARNSLARIKTLLAGRSGKFQVVVPVKRGSTDVDRIYDINVADIEQALTSLHAESFSASVPSQKRATWMAESSKYYRATLEFAEWYLAHDNSKVRF